MTWLYFVYTGTYLYIPRLTLYIPCVYTSNDNSVISCFRVVCCCWTMLAYILHAQYSAACSLKWKKTPVQTIRYVGLVHWCIYRYILHTAQYIQRYTILYLESGSSRLASPFCLGCLLVPCIARGVPLLHSLLDRQASKAGLAAPKRPQPRVDFIDIAGQKNSTTEYVLRTTQYIAIYHFIYLVQRKI